MVAIVHTPAGVGRQNFSRQLVQLGRSPLHRLGGEIIPQDIDPLIEGMEPLTWKHRHRLSSTHPPEIPGQGQAATLGLPFQFPLFLLGHPNLDGCRSLSVGHVGSLLSDRGDRGGAPFGAGRRPLLGCPRQHKSYARYPTRQGCGLSVKGFFSAERLGSMSPYIHRFCCVQIFSVFAVAASSVMPRLLKRAEMASYVMPRKGDGT